METYPRAAQRAALRKFASALGSRDSSLRCDECGDWRIIGKQGHVYAVRGALMPGRERTEGFALVYTGPEHIGSARQWGHVKRVFEAFGCQVTQDGDDEGVLFLSRLPSATAA